MPTQVSDVFDFELGSLNGQLVAWRQDFAQPQLIDIEGKWFVAVFPDENQLAKGMIALKVERYTIKKIDDAIEFVRSCIESGVTVCVNLHRVGARLGYTEIRLYGPEGGSR